jgi:hypothetical protein
MHKRVFTTVGMVLCGLAAFFLFREPTCACGTFDFVYIENGLNTQDRLGQHDSIPVPTGPVVLTFTGKIGAPNAGDRLDFDWETLKQVRTIGYEVDDPQLERPTFYTGVVLADLLQLARVAPDATTLRAVTTDGRTIDVPIAVARWPVIVAMVRGAPSEHKATAIPLQLVFPYFSEPSPWNDGMFMIEDRETYDPLWVEQLRSIEVR